MAEIDKTYVTKQELLEAIDWAKNSSEQVFEFEGRIRGKDMLLTQKHYNSIAAKSGQSIKIN